MNGSIIAVPAENSDSPTVLTPADLGVGARVTVAVMSDHYVNVVMGAIAAADGAVPGLLRETDPVSTFLRGTEQEIIDYLLVLLATAGQSGCHVSVSILLSRGCPGEVACVLPPGHGAPASPPTVSRSGQHAVAQWSLYPLADGPLHGPLADHMREITAAIELAMSMGTYVRTHHFVTVLAGDLGDVLNTVAAAWVSVGRTVAHTVSHVTISLNSPTGKGHDQ